jgi:cell division protein FtsI/penicillin-binding protein 2
MRRRRLLTRAAPLVVIAALAFVAGFVSAANPAADEKALAQRYVAAWRAGDYARMYGMLDSASRRDLVELQFASEYASAARTATLERVVRFGVGGPSGQEVPVRVIVQTRIFGTLRETLELPFSGSGSGAQVHFSGELLFPGLKAGEQLTRQVSLPPRAEILGRDGTPLAAGPSRSSPIPGVAGEIVGRLGPIPSDQADLYDSEGYPAQAKVGLDGLERIFQTQLAGSPGGQLLAGARVLAVAASTPGTNVTTSIDPGLEATAISAMGGQLAGIAAMDPRTGQLLALSGIAFSAPQPPGSTMKIITTTGLLQAGIVTPSSTFPVQTGATIDGYALQNAGGEACGGTLLNAFAVSCNSVFAPLGVRLGAARLVSIAERFGFNQPPLFAGDSGSTIPSATSIGDNLAVGSSAIGQGRVQSTPLDMADAGAAIAMGGRRPIPTLLTGRPPQFVTVTTRQVAAEVQRMMIAVVTFGTGTAAQISGVEVAGKTGTAELRNTTSSPNGSAPANTDAWFVGYAPVGAPRIVVGVLFPSAGYGGATAAPAARAVIEAALALRY